MVHCTYTINSMYQKDSIGNFSTSEPVKTSSRSKTLPLQVVGTQELQSLVLNWGSLLLKQKALLNWDE